MTSHGHSRFNFLSDYQTLLYLISRLGILFYVEFGPHEWTDIDYYYDVASRMLSGEIPFKDFKFQYPPLSLALIGLPALVWKFLAGHLLLSYATWFRLLMFAADGATYRLVCREAERYGRPGLVTYYLLSSSIFAYVLFDRLDIVLALMNFCVLTNVTESARPFRRALVVGMGTLFKLVPVILLPALIIDERLTKGRPKDMLKIAAWALAPVALGFLIAFLLGTQGDLQFITYHKVRGIEVASTWSSLIMLVDLAQLVPHIHLSVAYNVASFSNEIKGRGPALSGLSDAINWIMLLFLMSCTVLLYLRRQSRMQNRLCFFGAFILISFLICSKVFSPQYLIWVTPIMPFAFVELWGWKRVAAYGSFLAACALTTVFYPFVMQRVIKLETIPVLIVAARNLMILFIWLLLAHRLIEGGSPDKEASAGPGIKTAGIRQ